jgi:hypothetical protein
MFIGLIWIVVGIAVALWSGFVDGEVMAQHAAVGQWHLTLTSAIGLVLTAEGCRMFQYGWYNRARY